MKVYQGKDIRNLSLVGHSGAGKTTLAEGILRKYGYIDAKGSIDAGNTVSDFTKEEIDRKISIYSTLIPIEKDNTKINFIDTPGAFDFSGEIDLAQIEKSDFESQQIAEFQSQYQWFLALAFLLIFVDIFILERKTQWLKKLNLFNEKH